MSLIRVAGLSLLSVLVFAAGNLQASFVIQNTGVLNVHGAADVNYTVALGATEAAALSATPMAAVIRTTGWPINPWVANNTASSWIGPNNNATHPQNAFAVYTTTFNLTGFQPNTAQLAGQFAADNEIRKVLLNGVEVPGVSLLGPNNQDNFRNWHAFFIPSSAAFLSGWNTLQFVTFNSGGTSGNPTGLRVEFASVAATLIPEPASALMFIFGVPAAAVFLRRRSL